MLRNVVVVDLSLDTPLVSILAPLGRYHGFDLKLLHQPYLGNVWVILDSEKGGGI